MGVEIRMETTTEYSVQLQLQLQLLLLGTSQLRCSLGVQSRAQKEFRARVINFAIGVLGFVFGIPNQVVSGSM